MSLSRTIARSCLLLAIIVSSWFPLNADMLPTLAAQPTYLDVKISPDGSKIATNVQVDGRIGILILDSKTLKTVGWIKPTRFEAVGVYWANNTRLVVDLGERLGWREQLRSAGELWAVNYDGTDGNNIYGYRAGSKRSSRTKNTSPERALGSVIDPLPHDEDHILVSSEPFSRTGDELPTVVRLNVYTGKIKELIRAPIYKPVYLTDNKGEVRIAVGTTRENVTRAFHRASGRWKKWEEFEIGIDVNFNPIAMDDEKNELLFVGRDGNDRTGLHKVNLQTGETKKIYQHKTVDITSVQLSADGQDVLALRIDPGYSSYLIINKKHPQTKMFRELLEQFAGFRVSVISQSLDGQSAIVTVASDISPDVFFLYRDGRLELLFERFPDLVDKKLVKVEPISLIARDKTELHGYLTRVATKPGPLVVMVHGGPHYIRDYWAFDPDVQMLASMGINVLQVNFRGSGGYGNAFTESGFRQWGRNIQHDIIDATLWAIDQGVADREKICIMGTSFGGYSAVQSAILQPDLYTCAVAVSGVYDLPMLFRKGDVQQFYSGKAYLEQVLGDDRDELMAFSPVYQVSKLKAKMLIVHGVEDQRAPISHARKLMKALDAKGKPYEAHIEKKEGHGFFSAENKLAYYRLVAGFLQQELGIGSE